MHLVIGSTGNVGGEVVPLLLQDGQRVRALVRDRSRAGGLPDGAQIVIGDLNDEGSLAAAAEGVDGVFFMQLEPAVAQAEAMVRVARTAGVKRIALLSSFGTRTAPRAGVGEMIAKRDAVFKASGLAVTYLCPNTLMTNALWWAPSIREKGQIVDPTDPGATAPVDPYDVARIAVLALTHDGHAGHTYILNGPEGLTARRQVEILAEVLDRTVEFVAVTPAEYAEKCIAEGMPPIMAEVRQTMHEGLRVGRAGLLTTDIANLTGVEPRSFRDWCERNAKAFR